MKTFQRPRKGSNGAAQSDVLSPEASAILRDQLVAELGRLKSGDEPDAWTLPAWPGANTLTPADGEMVRAAFQARLVSFHAGPDEEAPSLTKPTASDEARGRIDKGVLALLEVNRRLRWYRACYRMRWHVCRIVSLTGLLTPVV